MVHRYRGLLFPALILVIALALIVPKLLTRAEPEATGGSRGGGGGVAVRVVTVQPEELQDRLVLNGVLSGWESVDLRSEVLGRVTDISFEEGTAVAAGELLVRLDDSELQAEAATLEAELALARQTLERRETLFADRNISEESLDQARNQVVVLEARLELIQARIAKTRIVAPFPGIIGLRSVSPGEILSPDRVIANLEQTDPLRLTFSLPEVYQDRLRPDMPVTLEVAGLGRTFSGRVTAWDPRVSEDSRTIRVRGKVPNPDGRLFPGNFASVELVLETIPDALMIPSTALVRGLERSTVYVAEDGQAAARTVTVGIRTRDAVQITSGLQAGDRVIFQGVQALRPGQAVRVVREGPAEAPLG
jgi:membrane fusion protein (multidrug efflux system)